jgi:hypothetical protein
LGSIRRNKYEVNGSKLYQAKREAFEKKAAE